MLTRLLFATFVVLIALRDILSELWLRENPVVFAFAISALTSGISLTVILIRGDLKLLMSKLCKKGVLMRAIPLGFLSVFIYGLGYYLVKRVGAGLFNVVDYGLTPIATVLLASLMFSEKIKKGFGLSILLYIIGVILLNWYRPMSGIVYLLPILAIPLAVSLSDGLTKWLLSADKGGFNKEELLVVRFLPGALVTAVISMFFAGGIVVQDTLPLILVSVFCGWLPLWILCAALTKANLSELAYWELLIPSLAFFGTLHLHLDENARFVPIVGALLILATQPLLTYISRRKSKRETVRNAA